MQIENSDGFSVSKLGTTVSFLKTGCPKLDLFLRGGLLRKGITQIYGESGTGKTQFALQFSLNAQIPTKCPNDLGGTAYICTEATFPSKRLHELLKKSTSTKYPVSNEKIFIEHISNTVIIHDYLFKIEDLEDCIFNSNRLPQLLLKYNIKLLVIDSIAATYRIENDLYNLKNRAKSLRNIGIQLHKLASAYEMAIVCINQVTAIVENVSIGHISNKEQPSLGITWASMITNSLYLYNRNNQRFLCIAGSPYLPCKTIEYEILDSGVVVKGL